MTALKILGVILLLFLLVGYLRLGAVVSFGDGLRIRACIGALRLTVYPRKPRKKKAKKPKEAKTEEPPKPKEPKPKKKKRAFPKPTLSELLDLADTAFTALGATVRRACKRVKLDPMELTVTFGDWDPVLSARLYGAANTLMYAVMPRAEETFDIHDPSLHLRVDFEGQRSEAKGALGVSLRVCDLFAIAFTLAIPLLKWFLRFKKAHRQKKDKTEQHVQISEQQSA